jgi:hypothetical protein
MAALGSALTSQLRSPAPTALRKQRGSKISKRAAVSTVVRAASTENKIESVAAAVDSTLLLPKGEYCESHHKTFRRPTRCATPPGFEPG